MFTFLFLLWFASDKTSASTVCTRSVSYNRRYTQSRRQDYRGYKTAEDKHLTQKMGINGHNQKGLLCSSFVDAAAVSSRFTTKALSPNKLSYTEHRNSALTIMNIPYSLHTNTTKCLNMKIISLQT